MAYCVFGFNQNQKWKPILCFLYSSGFEGFFLSSLETTSVKRTASPHWRQLGKVSLAFRLAS
jgi:hypothetical protein